ncbi:MAG: peptidyl-prolyl cis-trans isomerase [Thermoanaerobaculia bacterium]
MSSLRRALIPLCLACLACGGDGPLARYRGGEISRADLEEWMGAASRAGRREPRDQLDGLIVARTLAAEAERKGLDERPDVRMLLRREELALWRGLLHDHLEESIEVPPADIDRHIAEHSDQLHRPRRVRLWNLFKAVGPGASASEREAIRREVESIRARLLAGADFQEIARAESESQTRFQGGRMGPVAPGTLRPEIEAVAFELEDGEISRIIETPEGFTLLRCAGWIEESTLTTEEARSRVRDAMKRWRTREAWDALQRQLTEAVDVEIDRPTLTSSEPAPEDVVARVDGRELTRVELTTLAGGEGERRSPIDRAREVATRFGVAERIAARARAEGLELGAEERDRLALRRVQILSGVALDERLRDAWAPLSEAEVRRYFEDHAERFRRQPEFRLGTLRLSFDDDTLLERTRTAEAAAASLRSGHASLERLAGGPGVAAGGRIVPDTGWIARRRLAGYGPHVLSTVEAMAPGEVSDPVRQDDELWVLVLHAREEARPVAFVEVESEARAAAQRDRLMQLRREIVDGLLAELDVRVLGELPDRAPRARPGARRLDAVRGGT